MDDVAREVSVRRIHPMERVQCERRLVDEVLRRADRWDAWRIRSCGQSGKLVWNGGRSRGLACASSALAKMSASQCFISGVRSSVGKRGSVARRAIKSLQQALFLPLEIARATSVNAAAPIEIELPTGCKIRVPHGVSRVQLALVLDALQRRDS